MLTHPGVTGRKSGQAEVVYDPILSEPETAKYIGVSAVTLRRMRKAGKVAYIQLSENRIGYRQSQANALLDERTVQPAVQS
jgi:predicted site-specific integrase-resolvase